MLQEKSSCIFPHFSDLQKLFKLKHLIRVFQTDEVCLLDLDGPENDAWELKDFPFLKLEDHDEAFFMHFQK